MVKVSLSNGGFTLLDDEDYNKISEWKWSRVDRVGVSYAVRARTLHDPIEFPHTLYLHRVIMEVSNPKIEIDHIDRDGLNNQRSNLRKVPSNINQLNAKIRSDNSSGYRGVSWHIPTGKWVAKIRDGGKNRYLGAFDTAKAASECYNCALEKIMEKWKYE